MKYFHFLLPFLFVLAYVSDSACQPAGQNYIRTRTMLTEDGSQYVENIEYYDGLGRPFIHVQKGITPNRSNLVSLQEYDTAGRESKAWLPAVTSSDYLTPEVFKSTVSDSYNGDSRPYNMPVYESSPLSRPVKQYGPGDDWIGRYEHLVVTNYLLNTTIGDLSCKLYTVASSGELVENGVYDAGELYVTQTTDEDFNRSYSFTDKLGQLLLSRQIDDRIAHDTYYVYDETGNRCFVLPPAYQDEPDLGRYAYRYKYDPRNRCIEKTLPGCAPIKYVYDQADNLILSQDGEQRDSGKWTFHLYDKFRRLTVKGICTCDNPTFVGVQYVTCTLNKDNAGMVVPGGLGMSGYSTNLDLSFAEILEINYYDHYSFLSLEGYGNKSQFTTSVTSGMGLLTGHVTNLLNTDDYLYSATYYDQQGRPVKRVSDNHLGGYEVEITSYTFTGKPLQTEHSHAVPSKAVRQEVYTYMYDHAERLLKVTHRLDGHSPVVLSENTYDELGRLSGKKYHGNNILNSNYVYNIRGWLTGISGAKFTQNLHYTDTDEGSPTYFNGNIGQMTWKVEDESKHRLYDFYYDNLNRLKGARYVGTEDVNAYSVYYVYNKMGSIIGVDRMGVHSTAEQGSYFNTIDDLSLSYDGNQLIKVTDHSPHVPLYEGSFNYVDGVNAEKEFYYDKNGNLIRDLDKGIGTIRYNSLNLPSQIVFNSNRSIDYQYGSDGAKYRVRHVTPFPQLISPLSVLSVDLHPGTLLPGGDITLPTLAPDTLTTDYCGNVIYENGELNKILTPEGYITLSGTVPTYHYYLRDHQGNNRVVVKQDGMVEEVNHFYPYGGLFGESANANLQAYKYGGKELDRMHGLDWSDFGGRYMRFDAPGWMSVDPLCEKYYSMSPYVYCLGNPIRFIDPTGKKIQTPPGMGGYRNWSWQKYSRVTKYTEAMSAASNKIFEGSGVEISGSIKSTKAKVIVGSVGGEIGASLGNASVKANTNAISAEGSLIGVDANLFVKSASLEAGVFVVNTGVTVDDNVNTYFEPFSADAALQLSDTELKGNSGSTVSVGANISVVKVNLSIDFEAAKKWIVGALNLMREMFTPEIIVNTNVNEFN